MAETNPFLLNSKPRKEDDFGIVYMRGSQYLSMSFLDAVVASYSNLVYHPVTMMAFSLLVFVCLAESGDGPLEVFKTYLIKFIKDTTNPQFLITFANLILKLDDFLITYKLFVVKVGMVMVPCLSKPSSKTFVAGVVLSSLVILLPAWGFFEALVIGQLWYLFLQLRSPYHKIFVVLIGALLYLFPIFINPNPGPGPPPPPTTTTTTTPTPVRGRNV